MRRESDCIFCRIIGGEAPAITVYEDDHSMAFMDISPAVDGHTLVVSREHFQNILEIDAASLTAVTLAAQRVARAIYSALNPDGMRMSQFNGTAAGQTVFHYHAHLVPIRLGQRVDSHGRGPADPDRLEQIAAAIRTALKP